MPQIDLETLVSVCGGGSAEDRKVACETLAEGGELPKEEEAEKEPDLPPDFPPESFWLSKDAEFDWFDRNAFFDRKDSAKGNANSSALHSSANPPSNSSSQRFSVNLKSKPPLIGLPMTQNSQYIDATKRRISKPANIRLFPKRSESAVKSSLAEPSSPKVSCMGRVRSKRGRRKKAEPATADAKSAEKSRKIESRRTGILARFMTIIHPGRRTKSKSRIQSPSPVRSPPRNSMKAVAHEQPAAEPPGLGGMTRFASGRRSASSWSADDF